MRRKIVRSSKPYLDELGLKQPSNDIAMKPEEAAEKAERLGYPILLRPSFVLGGRGMFIVYDEEELNGVVNEAFAVAPGKPVLLDKFLRKRSSWMSIAYPMAKPPWLGECSSILNLPEFTVGTRPWCFLRTIWISI